jgi:hypothetical protein
MVHPQNARAIGKGGASPRGDRPFVHIRCSRENRVAGASTSVGNTFIVLQEGILLGQQELESHILESIELVEWARNRLCEREKRQKDIYLSVMHAVRVHRIGLGRFVSKYNEDSFADFCSYHRAEDTEVLPLCGSSFHCHEALVGVLNVSCLQVFAPNRFLGRRYKGN